MEQLPRSEVGKNKEYNFFPFFSLPISSQKVKYWEDHLKPGFNIDIIFQHQTNQPTNKPTNQPTSTTNNYSQHWHWHFQHLNADGLHKYLRPWRRRYNAGICQSWQSKLARLWVCCVAYKDLSIKGLFHFKINLEGCVSEHLSTIGNPY